MSDEMYFSNDEKALIRGKRSHRRTETCRPCLVTVADDSEPIQAVVLDVTPYGMLLRMLDSIPEGTPVRVQLMRDDNFRDPLGVPKEGMIIRSDPADGHGFVDHGVQIEVPEIPGVSTQPRRIPDRPTVQRRKQSRMHTIDFTVGGEGRKGGP